MGGHVRFEAAIEQSAHDRHADGAAQRHEELAGGGDLTKDTMGEGVLDGDGE